MVDDILVNIEPFMMNIITDVHLTNCLVSHIAENARILKEIRSFMHKKSNGKTED